MPLPPPETCSECGKTISRKAKAHAWQGQRVVCTGCFLKLDKPRREEERRREYAEWAEGVASRAHLPPTEAQVEFATELGVRVLPGVTRGQVSEMIDNALDRRDGA